MQELKLNHVSKSRPRGSYVDQSYGILGMIKTSINIDAPAYRNL